jgi:hypothetical protein
MVGPPGARRRVALYPEGRITAYLPGSAVGDPRYSIVQADPKRSKQDRLNDEEGGFRFPSGAGVFPYSCSE